MPGIRLQVYTRHNTTMKRLIFILLILPLGLNAQNMYNVTSLFGNDLVGTARFVGMGGAMSALGADLSTMNTNPAGMAVYRSNDASLTGGLLFNTYKSIYGGCEASVSNTNAGISNAAFVLSTKRDEEGLLFLNFGFGYHRRNNLSSVFEMFGAADGYSQQFTIDHIYKSYLTPFDYNDIKSSMYRDFSYSWLPLMAANAVLYDDAGNFITDPNAELLWLPDELGYYEMTTGGVNTLDFNMSANFGDRLYLGATVAVSVVDYTKYSEYRETDALGDIYILENNRYITGTGYDLKLGAIYRPFQYSPFKIGFSLHTPTKFTLREYSSATISNPYYNYSCSTTDSELYGQMLYVNTALKTPWRFGASMAYTFGTLLALDAEYEYSDYATSAFIGRTDIVKAQNEEIGYNMKAQHTLRIGAELNMPEFAVRAGYNYMTAPFVKDAYKEMYNASVAETSTEYMNRFGKSVMTLGLGGKETLYYWDLSYMLEHQKSEFYPFFDYDAPNPGATVRNVRHSIVATLGMRF